MPLKSMILLTEQCWCALLGLAVVHFKTHSKEKERIITQIILPKCSEKEPLVPQSRKDFQSLDSNFLIFEKKLLICS